MFSLEIDCDPEDRDLLIAELWEQGCAGISELDERRLLVFFDDSADRAELARQYPGAVFQSEESRDWVESD